jgi:hypothetical protein
MALVLPASASAEEACRMARVDTEHIFGFTEGTDIGTKGEIEVEVEGAFDARLGKVGSYAAFLNETALRYVATDNLRSYAVFLTLLADTAFAPPASNCPTSRSNTATAHGR